MSKMLSKIAIELTICAFLLNGAVPAAVSADTLPAHDALAPTSLFNPVVSVRWDDDSETCSISLSGDGHGMQEVIAVKCIALAAAQFEKESASLLKSGMCEGGVIALRFEKFKAALLKLKEPDESPFSGICIEEITFDTAGCKVTNLPWKTPSVHTSGVRQVTERPTARAADTAARERIEKIVAKAWDEDLGRSATRYRRFNSLKVLQWVLKNPRYGRFWKWFSKYRGLVQDAGLRIWWRNYMAPRLSGLAVVDEKEHLPLEFWDELSGQLSGLNVAYCEGAYHSFKSDFLHVRAKIDRDLFKEIIEDIRRMTSRDIRSRGYFAQAPKPAPNITTPYDHIDNPHEKKVALKFTGSAPHDALVGEFENLWNLAIFLRSGIKGFGEEESAGTAMDGRNPCIGLLTSPLEGVPYADWNKTIFEVSLSGTNERKLVYQSPFYPAFIFRERNNCMSDLYIDEGWVLDTAAKRMRYERFREPVKIDFAFHEGYLPECGVLNLGTADLPSLQTSRISKIKQQEVAMAEGIAFPEGFSVSGESLFPAIDRKWIGKTVFIKPSRDSGRGENVKRVKKFSTTSIFDYRQKHSLPKEPLIVEEDVSSYPLCKDARGARWNFRTVLVRRRQEAGAHMVAVYARVGKRGDCVVNVSRGARMRSINWIDEHLAEGPFGKERWAGVLEKAHEIGNALIRGYEKKYPGQDEMSNVHVFHVDFYMDEEGKLVFNEMHKIEPSVIIEEVQRSVPAHLSFLAEDFLETADNYCASPEINPAAASLGSASLEEPEICETARRSPDGADSQGEASAGGQGNKPAQVLKFMDAVINMAPPFAEDGQGTIIALGTNFIPGYNSEERTLLYKEINKLIVGMRQYCEDRGVKFIDRKDSQLKEAVENARSDKGYEDARVVVLAREETLSGPLGELRDDKRVFMTGIDCSALTGDSYIRIMEMVRIAMELSLRQEEADPPISPKIPMEFRNGFWVFVPKAEEMNKEALRVIYAAQRSA